MLEMKNGNNKLLDTSIRSDNIEINGNHVINNTNRSSVQSVQVISSEPRRRLTRRRTKMALYFCIHLLTLLITNFAFFQNNKDEPIVFAIAGGSVGFFSAAFVLGVYHLYPEGLTPPLGLLYWRSWSDLLIGLRFMLTYNLQPRDESLCGTAAGWLEFAEISSEMWYLCVAVDLAYSFTNPFSRYPYKF